MHRDALSTLAMARVYSRRRLAWRHRARISASEVRRRKVRCAAKRCRGNSTAGSFIYSSINYYMVFHLWTWPYSC